ncbi:ADP-ribosylation family protein [Dactylosporangium sp. NPDC005555]|uniref:ADP-ribosylation family protein n=1 Tax=Dactylosporangium sp. NPDC005555 TaxID=3154889 RepID=UPI0033B7E066
MGDDAGRRAALATMHERHDAVAERVQRVYGLRLPGHLAVFCAFWKSASDAERAAVEHLMVRPFGLTEYFADGGLERRARDGLDERLHARYRCDPPEFVTVLSGGSDGLHYGLWYDDPAEVPTLIVHNYARDSAETWANGYRTLLGELHGLTTAVLDERDDDTVAALVEPLLEALDWFVDADNEAVDADGPVRWSGVRRESTAVSVFPLLPSDAGDPQLGRSHTRLEELHAGGAEAAAWIARAEAELAAGEPALALAVGGELHWLAGDEHRDVARRLRADGYRLLGRDAIAGIVEVHAADAGLRDVDVLVATG